MAGDPPDALHMRCAMGFAKLEASGTTSVRLLWPFLELARKGGYDVGRVPKLLGLTDAQLRDPETRVSQRALADLLARAIELSGNRDLGLQAARLVDGAHVGILEYVTRARPSLLSALERNGRYMRLLGDMAQLSFEVQGKTAVWRVRFDPELVIHEAAYEFIVALAVLRTRTLTGIADLAPLEVCFMHPRPADTRRHQKLFRCKVRFGMPETQVVMSTKFLRRPMASAEPHLERLLEQQADAMLARLPRSSSPAARARHVLRAEHELREASAERVARRLGMSVRTLSRKLAAERTSYRALLDETRMHAAVRDLTQTARPIADIAYRLGFASSQSFHRAFRRWTGNTAAVVRERARKKRTRRPGA